MKPEETIDFHLRWLWLKIFRLYNMEAAGYGGSMSVGYVLLNIDKEGTPSTKLGPKMGIESRSLSRTLKSMENNGLITRRADSHDKRLMVVRLTDEGKRYRDFARSAVIRLNTYLQDQLEPKEVEQFLKTARKINTLLDQPDAFGISTKKLSKQSKQSPNKHFHHE